MVGELSMELYFIVGVVMGQSIPGEDLAKGQEFEGAGQTALVGLPDLVDLPEVPVEIRQRDGFEPLAESTIVLHTEPTPTERAGGVTPARIADQAQDLPVLGYGAWLRAQVGYLPEVGQSRAAPDLSHVAMDQQGTGQSPPGGLEPHPMSGIEDADGIWEYREKFRLEPRPVIGALKSSG